MLALVVGCVVSCTKKSTGQSQSMVGVIDVCRRREIRRRQTFSTTAEAFASTPSESVTAAALELLEPLALLSPSRSVLGFAKHRFLSGLIALPGNGISAPARCRSRAIGPTGHPIGSAVHARSVVKSRAIITSAPIPSAPGCTARHTRERHGR